MRPVNPGFRSAAVEAFLVKTRERIESPGLRWLFTHCFPNTLDTTVRPGTFEAAAGNSGLMHESYHKDDAARFTRAWFARANTLFGELIASLAVNKPQVLRS